MGPELRTLVMAEIAHDVQCMALRQLETALRLYFEREDYYSVITLAGASEEIFGKLLSGGGNESSLGSLKRDVSTVHKELLGQELQKKEIADRANEARNALKHWSSDKPEIVEFDAQDEAKDMLNRAIDNYYGLTGCLTSLMDRFQRETVSNNALVRSGRQ